MHQNGLADLIPKMIPCTNQQITFIVTHLSEQMETLHKTASNHTEIQLLQHCTTFSLTDEVLFF